jgi:arsenate reductase
VAYNRSGTTMTTTPTKTAILFLCTANAARSQMAEGLLRKHGGERFEVHSAGTEPTGIHPLTRHVLEEIGIDTSRHRSKHVNEFLGRAKIDAAIILCERARKTCPSIYPFAYQTHFWPFEDPAAFEGPEEARLAKFREVRDPIEARIQEWLAGPST